MRQASAPGPRVAFSERKVPPDSAEVGAISCLLRQQSAERLCDTYTTQHIGDEDRGRGKKGMAVGLKIRASSNL